MGLLLQVTLAFFVFAVTRMTCSATDTLKIKDNNKSSAVFEARDRQNAADSDPYRIRAPAGRYLESSHKPEKPYFDDVSPRNVTAIVGQSAVLHCRVKHLGQRTVSWMRKRDLHILTSSIFTYTGDARFGVLHPEGSDDWNLKIEYVQKRDAGIYECQVNTEPKINMAVYLHAEGDDGHPSIATDRIRLGRNRSGPITDRSSSLCGPHRGHSDKVWSAVSDALDPTLGNALEFTDKTSDREGRNSTRNTKYAAQATIQGPEDVYVKKGSTISLTCSVNVHSTPPGSVFWYHGPSVVDFDSPRGGISLETEKTESGITSKLLVTKASLVDSGNYTCVPSNANPSSVWVHVLNGEHPAAMQHGEHSSSGKSAVSACAFIPGVAVAARTYLSQCCSFILR